MGPTWGLQDPGELHIGPVDFAIWDSSKKCGEKLYVLRLASDENEEINGL